MNLLSQILAHKRGEIDARMAAQPLGVLRAGAEKRPAPPAFAAALRSAPIGLIAEVKHRSPSAGVIRSPWDPAAIARDYQAGGAHALSVLVDEHFFGGGESAFTAVRAAVALPLLYKEFVIDPWQVWHARSIGASAVLLIAAALPDAALAALMRECAAAGLEVLLEVHDEAEMRRAAALGASLIGVNNRDLRTFRTTLETSHRLRALAPAGCTFVSESGIRDAGDVRALREAGVHAVLVGEHLLRKPDLAGAVRDLMGA
ncbi:MAG: indole-3-glycerol phosphate synthase TrpC [Kiritimatiellia bacterium]